MEAKEKAKELLKPFEAIVLGELQDGTPAFLQTSEAKECAQVLCDQVIALLDTLHKPEYTSFYNGESSALDGYAVMNFWRAVKKEIELL